jgi:hypothetical protein
MRPFLRLFVACWNGVPGTAPLQYRIGDIKTLLFPKPGRTYPIRHEEFCFIAHLTGARGAYEFAVRQRVGVGPSGSVVWQSPPVTMDLGNNPLTVRFVPIRVRNVPFPRTGQYEFVLLCDGAELEPSMYFEARA